ncbi:esterase/lipase family protein [Pulveribacter suum]|uniref:Permease n=1 Tax=Pulveribacter suum TaxID=2116657 RepID=A0A2P1NIE3_9BURK|nr:alpha/beta fold hydrolase [Pulveribacter suum]AVP56839.1 permease [Pulveribacter suum]
MTNARWQRWLVATQLLLMAAWALAWWPHSRALALAGALALPLLARLAMVPQFVLMARVVRRAGGTPPTARQLLRAWWAEAGWAARVFGWWQPFRHRTLPDWLPPPPASASAPRGVVLVHGFLCNRGFWLPWLRLLRARGHACVAVTLEPPFAGIDDYAGTLDEAVRRVEQATGRAPLIVAHSMGGLAVRAWLRAVPGARGRIHRVATLGTPHQGTWAARHARSANGRQMRLHSPWLQALAASEDAALRGRFVCWHSDCDNVVYPAAAAQLPGAQLRPIAGAAHVELAFHPQVVSEVLALLEL